MAGMAAEILSDALTAFGTDLSASVRIEGRTVIDGCGCKDIRSGTAFGDGGRVVMLSGTVRIPVASLPRLDAVKEGDKISVKRGTSSAWVDCRAGEVYETGGIIHVEIGPEYETT